MAMLWWSFMCLLLLGLLVGDGEGYGPEEHFVRTLPGQPKVGFRQYAGYVDVDLEAGRSLFYYFVEAEVDSDNKPLTLWLNGGPGCSSIGGGAFSELGPFFPMDDGRTLRKNPYSWNKASNLLFVESPAGVGWLYSNTTTDYTTDDASTANDMLIFLIEWIKLFPVFQSRDLFLAGESYAGHVPQLAIAILGHNEKSLGAPLNVKGVAVGNPLLKAGRTTLSAQLEFFWSHGMYSDETYHAIGKDCDFDTYLTHNVSEACEKAIHNGNKNISDYIDIYDVLGDICYPAIVEQELRPRKMTTMISLGVDVCIKYEMTFYLNLAEVQEALHANRTKLPYDWSPCQNRVNYNYADVMINILPLLKHIMQNHIPVWIYTGDQDSMMTFIGSRTLARELAHESHFEATVPYGAWFHKGQVGGWATEYGNLLTFATVRGAGHMVPYTQPARALHLFSNFVRGRRLPNTTYYSEGMEIKAECVRNYLSFIS